jgi:hypothetical protein
MKKSDLAAVHYSIFKELRSLARKADIEQMSAYEMIGALLLMSDEHNEKYETLMLEQLVEDQNDETNPRYDYGLSA